MDIITPKQVSKAFRSFTPQSLRRFIQFKSIGRFDHDSYDELCRLISENLNKQLEFSENKIVAQSLAVGTNVTFNLKSRSSGWRGDRKEIIQTIFKGLEGNESIDCQIHTLSHHTELGIKESEFYDLKFSSGLILPAVNGYFIDIKEDKSLNPYQQNES
jgi:hypothetical protein